MYGCIVLCQRGVRLAGGCLGLADLHGLFAINFHNILENWAQIKGQVNVYNVISAVVVVVVVLIYTCKRQVQILI